jgi:hypothetical protein
MPTMGGIIYWKKKPRKGFTRKHELQEFALENRPAPNRRVRRALEREARATRKREK